LCRSLILDSLSVRSLGFSTLKGLNKHQEGSTLKDLRLQRPVLEISNVLRHLRDSNKFLALLSRDSLSRVLVQDSRVVMLCSKARGQVAHRKGSRGLLLARVLLRKGSVRVVAVRNVQGKIGPGKAGIAQAVIMASGSVSSSRKWLCRQNRKWFVSMKRLSCGTWPLN
jgi:hypothetical protein